MFQEVEKDVPTERVRERVLEQPCEIWVFEQGFHVIYDFLVGVDSECILECKIWPPTSTAVLLKVRHAGSGLIYGNANGPLERGS